MESIVRIENSTSKPFKSWGWLFQSSSPLEYFRGDVEGVPTNIRYPNSTANEEFPKLSIFEKKIFIPPSIVIQPKTSKLTSRSSLFFKKSYTDHHNLLNFQNTVPVQVFVPKTQYLGHSQRSGVKPFSSLDIVQRIHRIASYLRLISCITNHLIGLGIFASCLTVYTAEYR